MSEVKIEAEVKVEVEAEVEKYLLAVTFL